MSQYIQFYLRSKSDEFLPIGTFSASNKIYQAFNGYAPWEKLTAVHRGHLENVRLDLEARKISCNKGIKHLQDEIEFLKGMKSDSLESILQTRHEICSYIVENQEEIAEIDAAIAYINMLDDIIDAVAYGEEGYDKARYLYVGIEVNPSVEKII